MALPSSFKLRIEDLAGFAYANNDYSTADDAALQQFLVDGCYDVVFRVSAVTPDIVDRFTTKTSSGSFTNGSASDTYREIAYVYRNGLKCTAGKSRYHDSYTDSTSIHYAHAERPTWYIFDGGIYIQPAPSSVTVDIYHLPNDYSINVDSNAITDFPKAYYEHICLYAAIRVLDYRIQEVVQEDEDPEMMGLLRAQQQKLQADYEAKFAIQSGGRK